MSHLRTSAEGYLATRRALGFKLLIQGRLLEQFVDYLEDRGLETVTAEAAIAWASAPGTSAVWHGMRFGVARRFALHLELLDPRCEVPPFDAVPERYRRLPPHIYSAAEITALMDAARRLHPTLRAATLETVIGLLAVTGMRSGEVLRLNRSEVDLAFGTLRVIATKGNKSRELALHDSSVAALTTYTRLRDEAFPIASSPSFFVSRAGHRLNQSTFHAAFQCVVDAAGLVPPPGSRARRPRPGNDRLIWPHLGPE